MDKKTEGALQIAFAVVIMIAAFYLSANTSAMAAYGYAGVFLVAMISSATIIFPAPGWAAVIAMSSYLNPFLLGLAAGTGAAIGELTGYLAGEGARDLLSSRIKESGRIEALVRKYGLMGIFLLAFIPNPLFDIAGLVAGGMRIPWWKFLLACAAGRVLRYALLAMLGAFTFGLVD